MRIITVLALFWGVAFSETIIDFNEVEKRNFTCEMGGCFICLGERTASNCEAQGSRGFIDFTNPLEFQSYGRGGFVIEACQLLSDMYFGSKVDINDIYSKNIDSLKKESDFIVNTYSFEDKRLSVYQYLEVENHKDLNSKRVVDVMRCSIINPI